MFPRPTCYVHKTHGCCAKQRGAGDRYRTFLRSINVFRLFGAERTSSTRNSSGLMPACSSAAPCEALRGYLHPTAGKLA